MQKSAKVFLASYYDLSSEPCAWEVSDPAVIQFLNRGFRSRQREIIQRFTAPPSPSTPPGPPPSSSHEDPDVFTDSGGRTVPYIACQEGRPRTKVEEAEMRAAT